MIINQNPNRDLNLQVLQDVVDFFNTQTRRVFVTGSKFFGGDTNKSDYDFFVDYDAEFHDQLMNLGFKHLEYDEQVVVTNMYNSADIAIVLEYICPMDRSVIQLQMLQNGMAETKNNIQNFLFGHKIGITNMDKESRKTLWNIMFDMYNSECGYGNTFMKKETVFQQKVDIKKPSIANMKRPTSYAESLES